MTHLVILGRQPEFGLLELESILGPGNIRPFGPTAALLQKPLDLNKLGGSLKLARIIHSGPKANLARLLALKAGSLALRDSKTPFGISLYDGKSSTKDVTALGLNLKKQLQKRRPVRFVAPKAGTAVLSAAQIKFNKLILEGFELLVVTDDRQIVIGLTEQIQNIDWYAKRDYGRPARSPKVGMLPPKLAQIMINTTQAPLVYDPFCGTGVILQETLLSGRTALGSDIAPEMIEASEKNLEWLDSHYDTPEWYVKSADARHIKLADKRQVAIVSEGYLGPNMVKKPSDSTYGRILTELQKLYEDSLINWSAQLVRGAEVTLMLPYWQTESGWKGLPIIDRLPDLGYTLKVFKHVDSRKLIYRRPNQIVGRQLLIMTKS